VKVVTKEKKEKENVLIYLELVNLNNAFLLNSKELRRKITKVEKEKLVEEKEYKKKCNNCKHNWRLHKSRGRVWT